MRSHRLRLAASLTLIFVIPLAVQADEALCELHAKTRNLSGEYLRQSVEACVSRGKEMRAKLSQNPIVGMQQAGGLCAYAYAMRRIDPAYMGADIAESAQILDELVPKAVAAANGNADLTKAIKEYYAAASAFCADGSPRSEPEYRAKSKALELETKLAGIR